jgi:hypothetical protein
MKGTLSVLLAVMFLVLSFNAYACLLLPTPERPAACPSSENDTPRLFCDAFKTLALQSLPDSAENDRQLISAHSVASIDDRILAVSKKASQEASYLVSQPLAIVATTVLRI